MHWNCAANNVAGHSIDDFRIGYAQAQQSIRIEKDANLAFPVAHLFHARDSSHLPQSVLNLAGDTVERLEPSGGLPPLTVGLCSLKSRLASPLVKSLWDVAGQTYRAPV